MQDLNDLFYFVQIVDHGGFAAAGRALGIPKSKLSRRMQLLEERLGVRLVNRSSRRFSMTEVGREYYERCVAMLVEAEAAEHVIAELRAEPRGIVRISCPIALLGFQFGALFARFMMENPAVELHLEATNRRVDVMAEGFDIAIRVRFPPLQPTDLVMRKLDTSTQCLVASPALIPHTLRSPADLAGMPSVDLGPRRDHQWQLEGPDRQTAALPHRPRLVTDDMAALRQAALTGVGVAQLPTMMVWQDIEQGRLVHALPDWRPRAGIVHAVFPSRRGLLPSVRTLLDYLAKECARQRSAAASSLSVHEKRT
ncbi:LysR substrate-binding domain-containing protein [Bradyrhizobium sp. ISRA443]|uniref:LysR substrate-binding domain-containing protein n=1 Tax=unclassified Bradyrhizobium TaxID=2631580 RepID=UPI00247A6285|nr:MULTISPECIES: LysR substrate-binding domain-containing protein [unclassified Bradyrhizobium]WGR92122.1 LysR substrate-binding domain-containing protein [Bradyrhizobium sp. ISRA435]WGR96375.1 LysR substrate-binding domain-containing protein [Bradyrhizobium sp. ISRA436]WGS03260.1 LysR substrate-binding domain-containing protein [Bradyrhizobium sp. ISRA437]WGS10144.1 LysR substrate-binding domain-containing protein [Bradyrhizobium sp. ISRA443]